MEAACAPPAAEAWRMSHSTNNFVALDPGGHDVGRWPVTLPDPIDTLVGELHNRPAQALALPDKLDDALMAPLVRSQLRCELVVRDPTLIHAAPVYLKAWEKGGGSIHVVEPVQLLAVATNPINDCGPDADRLPPLRTWTWTPPDYDQTGYRERFLNLSVLDMLMNLSGQDAARSLREAMRIEVWS